MTTRRPRGSARTRAEARRRARNEARGIAEGDSEIEEPVDERSRPVGGGFLSNLFPPAPPLPGQSDPFADFHYDGPLRSVVASLYLLVRHPLPWMTGQFFMGGSSLISFAASLVAFGGLIGAGWFAPWRPWLAGLAAGVVGWLAFLGFVLFIGASGTPVGSVASPDPRLSTSPSSSAAPSGESPLASASAGPTASPAPSATPATSATPAPPEPTAGAIAASVVFQIVIQGVYGGIGGFYGGYLRRRMAASPGRQGRGTTRGR
jgi:hypothetical protein